MKRAAPLTRLHSIFTWRRLVTPYSLNYHSLQLLLCIATADNHTSVPPSLLLSTSPAGWRTRPLTSPLIRRLMALWRETLAIGWSQRSTTWWRCAPWCLCSFLPASTPSYIRGIYPVAHWLLLLLFTPRGKNTHHVDLHVSIYRKQWAKTLGPSGPTYTVLQDCWLLFHSYIFLLFLPTALFICWSPHHLLLYRKHDPVMWMYGGLASSMFALIRVGFRGIWAGPRPRLTLLLHKHTQECYLCFYYTPTSAVPLPASAALSPLPPNTHCSSLLTFFLSWTENLPSWTGTTSVFYFLALFAGMTWTS